jgi:hypothetical protein
MRYKWKPSKSAKKAFAIKMQDPQEAADYEARKAARSEKRRSNSSFDYNSAGGYYIATSFQNDTAHKMLSSELTAEQTDAARQIIYSFSCRETIHHDYIHIVNEYARS